MLRESLLGATGKKSDSWGKVGHLPTTQVRLYQYVIAGRDEEKEQE